MIKKHKIKDHDAHDGHKPLKRKKKERDSSLSRCSSQSDNSPRDISNKNDLVSSMFSTDRPSMLMNTFEIVQQKKGQSTNEPIEISDGSDHSYYSSSAASGAKNRKNRFKKRKKRRKVFQTDRKGQVSPGPHKNTHKKHRSKSPNEHRHRSKSPSEYKKRSKSPKGRSRSPKPKRGRSRSPKPKRGRSKSPHNRRSSSPHRFSTDRSTETKSAPVPLPPLDQTLLNIPFEGQGKIAIFWDYENILPQENSLSNFSKLMRRYAATFREFGEVSCFHAYIQKPIVQRYHEILQGNGIQLVKSPTHRKEAADKCLIADICMHAVKNKDEQVIYVIMSDDGDFMYVMQRLKQMGCHVIWIGSRSHSKHYFEEMEPSTSFYMLDDFFQLPKPTHPVT